MFEHRAEVIAVVDAVMALMIYLRGKYAMDADWNEGEHPRQEDGKFGEGGGGSVDPEKNTGRSRNSAPVAALNGDE
jgi:hypothetical protein